MSEPTVPGPPIGPPPGSPPGPPPGPPPPWQGATYPEPPNAPNRSRGRTIFLVGLALVASLSVIAAAFLLPGVVDDLTGDGAVSPRIEAPTNDDVLVFPDLGTEHRDDDDIDYEQVPPVGGPHDPEWLDCGRYDEQVRDENATHDLEHGTVWITYDPALPDDDVDALEALLPDDGILSPYPGLPSPVVVTVWGVQLHLTGADDPRLPQFLDDYGDGHTAPEAMASCEGGTDDPQGGPGGVDA